MSNPIVSNLLRQRHRQRQTHIPKTNHNNPRRKLHQTLIITRPSSDTVHSYAISVPAIWEASGRLRPILAISRRELSAHGNTQLRDTLSAHGRQNVWSPSEVTAEEGVVYVKGPDAVDVKLTPEAAEETSDRLVDSAVTARGQRRLGRMMHRAK